MRRATIIVAVFALPLAWQLQGCGGAVGEAANHVPSDEPDPRMTVSETAVSVSGEAGELPPPASVLLTIEDPPSQPLTMEADFTSMVIEAVLFQELSPGHVQVNIQFRAPASVANGTYADRITIRVCPSAACASQIRGSPVTITTSYDVQGPGISFLELSRDEIQLAIEPLEPNSRTEQFHVELVPAPPTGSFWTFEHSMHAIQSVDLSRLSTSEGLFSVVFTPSAELGAGIYDDAITARICYDLNCVHEISGSPFTVTSNVIVGVGPEPGYAPLGLESRSALTHDIVDAEFSQPLRRVVMASGNPVNALYVYDIASGSETQQLLAKAPTSLSLSPDGLTAAVGHDALISVVDLAGLAQPSPQPPTEIVISLNIYDLVLDGNGRVHAFEYLNTWGQIHSVNIATRTEELSVGRLIAASSHGLLHPDGQAMYTVGTVLGSPEEFGKWTISSGRAEWDHDSPYFGVPERCGNLWFDGDGGRIYTACGNIFSSSETPTDDMVLVGQLALSTGTNADYRITHLTQPASDGTIMLIEHDRRACDLLAATGPCYSHLALYEPVTLDRLAVFSIPPVTVDGTPYRQFGLFVFPDAVTGKKYLLSRLREYGDPARSFYLSVVP